MTPIDENRASAITEAEKFALRIVAGSFAHVDLKSVIVNVDAQLDRWIADDEVQAMESVIIAYGILGDVVEHVNTRLEVPHAH